MKIILKLIVVSLLLTTCSKKRSEQTSIEEGQSKLIKHADSLFLARSGIKLFFQGNDTAKIQQVLDTLNWPGSTGIVYNVLTNGKYVLLVKVIPIEEAGDFNLVSSYYLDKEGKVVAIVRTVRFFNETCSNDIVIERKYFERRNESFVLKSFSLLDGKGNKLDTLNCQFGDFPKTNFYKGVREIPVAKNL